MRNIFFEEKNELLFINEFYKNYSNYTISQIEIDNYNVLIHFKNLKEYKSADIDVLLKAVSSNISYILDVKDIKLSNLSMINLLEKDVITEVIFEIDLMKTIETKTIIDIFVYDRYSNLVGRSFLIKR